MGLWPLVSTSHVREKRAPNRRAEKCDTSAIIAAAALTFPVGGAWPPKQVWRERYQAGRWQQGQHAGPEPVGTQSGRNSPVRCGKSCCRIALRFDGLRGQESRLICRLERGSLVSGHADRDLLTMHTV